MICKNCKNEIKDGSAFCPICGMIFVMPAIIDKPTVKPKRELPVYNADTFRKMMVTERQKKVPESHNNTIIRKGNQIVNDVPEENPYQKDFDQLDKLYTKALQLERAEKLAEMRRVQEERAKKADLLARKKAEEELRKRMAEHERHSRAVAEALEKVIPMEEIHKDEEEEAVQTSEAAVRAGEEAVVNAEEKIDASATAAPTETLAEKSDDMKSEEAGEKVSESSRDKVSEEEDISEKTDDDDYIFGDEEDESASEEETAEEREISVEDQEESETEDESSESEKSDGESETVETEEAKSEEAEVSEENETEAEDESREDEDRSASEEESAKESETSVEEDKETEEPESEDGESEESESEDKKSETSVEEAGDIATEESEAADLAEEESTEESEIAVEESEYSEPEEPESEDENSESEKSDGESETVETEEAKSEEAEVSEENEAEAEDEYESESASEEESAEKSEISVEESESEAAETEEVASEEAEISGENEVEAADETKAETLTEEAKEMAYLTDSEIEEVEESEPASEEELSEKAVSHLKSEYTGDLGYVDKLLSEKEAYNREPEEKKNGSKLGIILGIVLVLAAVASGAGYYLWNHTPERQAEKLLNTAESAYIAKDYKTAEENYSKLFEYGNLSVESYLNLADSYYNNGEHEKAISILKDALAIYPENKAISDTIDKLYPVSRITPGSGSFGEAVTVEISVSGGNDIYYTLTTDGAAGAEMKYEAPIVLETNGTYEISAYGTTVDGYKGPAVSETFVVNIEPETVPETEAPAESEAQNENTEFSFAAEYAEYPDTLVQITVDDRQDMGEYSVFPAKVYHGHTSDKPEGDGRDVIIKISNSAWLHYIDYDYGSIPVRDAYSFLPYIGLLNATTDENGVVTKFDFILGSQK